MFYKLPTVKVSSSYFAVNNPPRMEGPQTFQVDIGQESVYIFNATDEGDSFTVNVIGGLPVNSALDPGPNGTVYTFTWTLMESDNITVVFSATDSQNATYILTPQVQICRCENNGNCTLDGLLNLEQNPILMNCQCTEGKRNYK